MSIVGDVYGNKKDKIEYYKYLNKKNIIINKAKIKKLSNLVGFFPSVVLSPEDSRPFLYDRGKESSLGWESLTLTGPLFGKKMTLPQGGPLEIEEELLKKEEKKKVVFQGFILKCLNY